MQPNLEVIFVAADSPTDAAALLASALGVTAGPAGDGRQQVISGPGLYLVIEPSSADKPQGSVTIWLRTPDARASQARLVASGCEQTETAHDVGKETAATVRPPRPQPGADQREWLRPLSSVVQELPMSARSMPTARRGEIARRFVRGRLALRLGAANGHGGGSTHRLWSATVS